VTPVAEHWAARYVGRPWTLQFRCYDLVREVFLERHGVELPLIALDEPVDHGAAIRLASSVASLRAVEGPPQPDDVVFMDGHDGLHVGVMIDSPRGPLLLHCAGRMTPRGPRGGVVAQSIRDATSDGYHRYRVWRIQK
jgi:hypothetical protein